MSSIKQFLVKRAVRSMSIPMVFTRLKHTEQMTKLKKFN